MANTENNWTRAEHRPKGGIRAPGTRWLLGGDKGDGGSCRTVEAVPACCSARLGDSVGTSDSAPQIVSRPDIRNLRAFHRSIQLDGL